MLCTIRVSCYQPMLSVIGTTVKRVMGKGSRDQTLDNLSRSALRSHDKILDKKFLMTAMISVT